MPDEEPVNNTAGRDVAASLLQGRWAETNQVDAVRYQQIACVAADVGYGTYVRLVTCQRDVADPSLHLKRREVLALVSEAMQMAFRYYANERRE